MDRFWLLTNTTYGSWLPGDMRGFVGHVRDQRVDDPLERARVVHNVPGTEYDEDMPGLEVTSNDLLRGPPIALTLAHAEALLAQFQETARIRSWELRAIAIMFNHFHIVVGVIGDPKPSKILSDFKSWGTRALTRQFSAPLSETWWTGQGSKRKLPNEDALAAAIHYVLYQQPNALLTWSPETGLHYGPP